MRNLANYKGAVTTLQNLLKTCRSSNRREHVKALRFAQMKIRRIEKKVLVQGE